MRARGYVRCSTSGQEDSGAGVTAQRHSIELACSTRGWELADVVVEQASAKGMTTKARPKLNQLLDDLDTGVADALVVAKLDRLVRSIKDFTTILERSRRETTKVHRWALVVVDLGIDLESPYGEAVAGVLAVFAQLERNLIGQRTREALAEKRAQGVVLGRPRTLSENVRERIYTERAKGLSPEAIARGLNEDAIATAQGGARWHPSTVRKVLERSRT